ncbi:hypothetical protein QE152_g35877 [Popillia japonica]|uniref:Reverse transcriptase n=1 Tax=Popillia japonica TaxID=7064 RepID=A0AAW1IEK7_POPJA
MDTQQFQKFLEIQARQQEQITQILQQLIRSQNVSASQSDSTEIEVKSIIKNFKCEKYDSNTAAETFIDYFEAQCRMWGLENKPDNVNFLNAKLFSSNQYGFRIHRSTVQAVSRVVYDVVEGQEANLSVTMCALSKAFDCVKQAALVDKLYRNGIRGNINELIRS